MYTTRQLLVFTILGYMVFSSYYLHNWYVVDDVQVFHYSKVLSRINGYLGNINVPVFLRAPLYGAWMKFFNGDVDDFIGKYEDYETSCDFFSRPIKPRALEGTKPYELISPVDGNLMSITEVKKDSVFFVKGQYYSFTELLFGKTQRRITSKTIQK